jgi:ATP adenylyltransferase
MRKLLYVFHDTISCSSTVRLMGENHFRSYIFVPEKARYSKGLDRPKVDCLLCAMARGDKEVETKVVFQDPKNMIVLNKFPYNPGHLMIFPRRHVEKLHDLTEDELMLFFKLVKRASVLIEETYKPEGINFGINQGRAAGASVSHFHMHVVPRYQSETGFMEIFSGSRVIHESLDDSLKKLLSNIAILDKDE